MYIIKICHKICIIKQTHAYVHMYTFRYAQTYKTLHICIYMYICMCVYNIQTIYAYICTCVYMCSIYVCMYVCKPLTVWITINYGKF